MTPLRILISGSRVVSPAESEHVRHVLRRTCSDALAHNRPVTLVHGDAPGVDTTGRNWALETPGVTPEAHPADWKTHAKAAGAIRNAEMVKAGADVCVAFPALDSRGTWDCIRKAADAGIPVRIYPLVAVTP